jgi:methionyl-tRNA formyltransferase
MAPAAAATPPRVAFLGTPEVAVATLRAVHDAGVDVPIVVSAPDRRRGRGGATSPSPVKAAALDLGLAVTDDPDDVLTSGATVGVVVAYGRLIRPHLLDALPFVNLHFSLLPRWRGAAPVERAILAGDQRTGVCLMEVTEGLDEGGVFARAETDVDDKTLDQLRDELSDLGNGLLLHALRHGFGEPEPQVGEPVYAHKLAVEDRHLDWSAPAEELLRVVRLGGAWTTFRGRRVRIVAATPGGDHGVEPTIVQPEGKGPMPFTDWRNGAQPGRDEWFS